MSASSSSLACARMSAARHAAPFHPHVERGVEAQREAALGLVELHRGNADVERDAVEIARDRVERAEARLDEPQALGIFGEQRRTAGDRRGIAVERDDAGATRQQGAAVAAGAESAVEIKAAFADLQRVERLFKKYGNVSHAATFRIPGRAPARPRSERRKPRPPRSGIFRPGRRTLPRGSGRSTPFSRSLRLRRPSGSGFSISLAPRIASDRSSRSGRIGRHRLQHRLDRANSLLPPQSSAGWSSEGWMNTPSSRANAARNGAGSVSRPFASSGFVKCERNTPPCLAWTQRRRRRAIEPGVSKWGVRWDGLG